MRFCHKHGQNLGRKPRSTLLSFRLNLIIQQTELDRAQFPKGFDMADTQRMRAWPFVRPWNMLYLLNSPYNKKTYISLQL